MATWWEDQLGDTLSERLPVCAGGPSATGGAAADVRMPAPYSPASLSWAPWWAYARSCAHRLALGIDLPLIDLYGPVLDHDEEALLSAELSYSRLYGGDGRYDRSDVFVVGRPALMVGALAATAAVNYKRKSAARRDAQVRWRDHQQVQVVATSSRVMWQSTTGWLDAWYGDVREFYPDMSAWSLTLAFSLRRPPLRLTGPAAPAVAVIAATAVLGRRWVHDPRFAGLLRR
jgi:hypothetical protein